VGKRDSAPPCVTLVGGIFLKFIIHYQPVRANFLETMTQDEGAAVGAHFEYLKRLLDDGKLVFAGRRNDAAFGIAVFEAETTDQAKVVVDNDPVVKAGVFVATCGEFQFALVAESLRT
jgi:uncharacterized protein YciI